MSPVRFLENTTLPAPIMATLITADTPSTPARGVHRRLRAAGTSNRIIGKAAGGRSRRLVHHGGTETRKGEQTRMEDGAEAHRYPPSSILYPRILCALRAAVVNEITTCPGTARWARDWGIRASGGAGSARGRW